MSGTKKIKVHTVLIADGPGHESVYNYGSALPLGCVISYAKVYKSGLLKQFFDFQPMVNRTQADFEIYLKKWTIENTEPSIWLIASYVWNHNCNMAVAKTIKRNRPEAIILAGGPNIPAYEQDAKEFLQSHPFIDVTVRGEGEVTLAEILETLHTHHLDIKALHSVNGLSFRNESEVIRTQDRVRTRNIDIFPSPYLTGEFDDPSFDDSLGMMLETNRGCPYGCTFCDWGSATLQKFSMFDIERVKKEVEFMAKKRARQIYLTDSNFGAFARDVEIAQHFADIKKKYGYPEKFGASFAKNASPRLAEITKILFDAKLKRYGLVSIQSTDENVLSTIQRSNIKQEKHEKLIDIFKNLGMTLSSELMIGLPGQTFDSHKKDLQYFFDHKLMTVAYLTSVMPNAPLNEPTYKAKNKIVYNDIGLIISTSTFSENDYYRMKKFFLAFQLFYVLGVLKYFLYYIQLEHSIKAMDFVDNLLRQANDNKNTYPLTYALYNDLLNKTDPVFDNNQPTLRWTTRDSEFFFKDASRFYREVLTFLNSAYGITLPKSVETTLLDAQLAVMPSLGKTVPLTVQLPHDFVSYFEQVKRVSCISPVPDGFKSLEHFGPGKLMVKAVRAMTISNLNLLRVDQHKPSGWELKSSLRF